MDAGRLDVELRVGLGEGFGQLFALVGFEREQVLEVVLGALQGAQLVGQRGDLRSALGERGVLLLELRNRLGARSGQPLVLLVLRVEHGLQLGVVQLAFAQALRAFVQGVLQLGDFGAQALENGGVLLLGHFEFMAQRSSLRTRLLEAAFRASC